METGGDSVEVKTKMAAGLTREQAHSAIKHQAAFTKAFDSRITSKTKAQS